jgi:hypothetical protein
LTIFIIAKGCLFFSQLQNPAFFCALKQSSGRVLCHIIFYPVKYPLSIIPVFIIPVSIKHRYASQPIIAEKPHRGGLQSLAKGTYFAAPNRCAQALKREPGASPGLSPQL